MKPWRLLYRLVLGVGLALLGWWINPDAWAWPFDDGWPLTAVIALGLACGYLSYEFERWLDRRRAARWVAERRWKHR